MKGYHREWWALTKREREILFLAAEGLTAAETADRLYIAPQTVKFHRTSLFQKLGAKSITHAVSLAYQQRIIELPGIEQPPRVVIDGIDYEQKRPAA